MSTIFINSLMHIFIFISVITLLPTYTYRDLVQVSIKPDDVVMTERC